MEAVLEHENKMVRKQYLIEAQQIVKLKQLSKETNESAAAIVRKAIDAYHPSQEESDLLDFALEQIMEARIATKNTIKQLENSRKLRASGNE
jgi:predicted DNA-binding protein